MRPNRYIIIASILLGAIGTWLSVDAISQYMNMARSFSSVNARYVEESFAWEDPQHERANATFTVTNNSDNDATLDFLTMSVYFDGQFAGARYDSWAPLDIPAGESVELDLSFLISISELRPRGGEADITVRGQLRLDFEGIERDMTVPTSGRIGQVSYEGRQ
jgi:hypothetical protein